jgi:hypothetical protein
MRQLWSPGWLVRHAVALACVVGFLALGWWQVRRAAAGNVLSYAYAVEWPVFAAFVVFLWVKEVRALRRGGGGAPSSPRPPRRGVDGEPTRPPVVVARPAAAPVEAVEESTLTAYNRYLAWLKANPQAAPSDYPGRDEVEENR